MPGKFRQIFLYANFDGGSNMHESANWSEKGTWYKTWWSPLTLDHVLWTLPSQWVWHRWTYWLNEDHLEAPLTDAELFNLWPGHPRHDLEANRAAAGGGRRRFRRYYQAKAKAKAKLEAKARPKAKAMRMPPLPEE